MLLSLAPRGWMYQNLVKLGRLNQTAIESIDPAKQIIRPKNVDQLTRELNSISSHPNPYNVLANSSAPNYRRAWLVLAYNQTLANEAQVVCALERYHFAHGQYPETLEMLVPKFIEKLSHDIIGGQALKYRKEKEQFVFYSIGWNEKDENGIVAPKKGGSADMENGDWCWVYRERLFK